MNKRWLAILFLISTLFLSSCSSYYKSVSMDKMDAGRKEVPRKFAEAYLEKCAKKDYTPFEGFNISKKFERVITADSLRKSCAWIEKKYGTVRVKELVSVHTYSRPADFMDIFNFKLETEKSKEPRFLHIGVYRDKNFIDVPFYFDGNENYLAARQKKYRQYKKKNK